jgi:hypothetical protein
MYDRQVSCSLTLFPLPINFVYLTYVMLKIYGDRFESFMRNFEKSFGSTLWTLHLINETPVCQQDIPQCCYRDSDSISETKLDGADSLSQIHDVQKDISLNSMDGQIIVHSGVNQQLVHLTRSRSTPETEQHILSVFERSLNEQARSNGLKELEIGLTMRKLQLKKSRLDLSSDAHMLEKVKVSMGFEKASFKKEEFKTQMEDSRHAELLRKLIDMHLTAVILMSVCFGCGTYTYSYQRITAVTAACAAASRVCTITFHTNLANTTDEKLISCVPLCCRSLNRGGCQVRCLPSTQVCCFSDAI